MQAMQTKQQHNITTKMIFIGLSFLSETMESKMIHVCQLLSYFLFSSHLPIFFSYSERENKLSILPELESV